MLACDLLVAGVDGDAVVALAAESARTLPAHDASRRLAAVSAELGLPEPDLPTAVALVAADTCERILDGSARRCGVVTTSVPWLVFVTLVRQTARYG